MTCICNAFYVGKTKRELCQRIGDHLYYSTGGKFTAVGRHIGLHHRFKFEVAKFFVLEVIPQNPRGGNWDKLILQREILWIERLNAIVPPGLNEVISYRPFL